MPELLCASLHSDKLVLFYVGLPYLFRFCSKVIAIFARFLRYCNWCYCCIEILLHKDSGKGKIVKS